MRTLKLLFLLSFPFFTAAQDRIFSEVYQDGFSFPVDIAFDQDNNMFVIEKRGTVKVVKSDGKKTNDFFIDLRDRVNSSANERGLLGIAFDPEYADNGYFYVHYTGINFSRISRFTNTSDTTADKNTEVEILQISQPYNNHNGGTLHFGPDGYLYIGMGDGGSKDDPQNRSQNRKELLGKMLRIDVVDADPYRIPNDNPFIEDDNTFNEIWALGLRNPWKFSFDMLTGDLFIADVGQNSWEEVDMQPASSKGGENYGWRCYEGNALYISSGCESASSYTSPVFVYETNENKEGCSITGGYVYRGSDIPYLHGRYVYGDFCSGKIWALTQDGCGNWYNEFLIQISSQDLSTFGQDNNGEIYFAEVGKGTISKIKPNCALTSQINVQQPTCDVKGTIVVTSNSTNATINITGGDFDNLDAGIYQITVTDLNCSNQYCVELEEESAFDFPMVEESDPLTICEGNPFTFTFSPPILANYPNLTMDLYLDTVLLVTNWNGVFNFDKGGIYQLKFINNDGCSTDFIPIFDLTIAAVPKIYIEREGETLVATPGFITYLWYNGTTPITGVTSNILTDIIPGEKYSVIGYTIAGCLSISEKFFVSSTGDVSFVKSHNIGPNPTSEDVTIDVSFNKSLESTLNLFNVKGEIVYSKEIPKSNRIEETISIEESGIYLLQIIAEGQTFSHKIIRK